MTVTNFIWDEVSDNVLFETDENGAVTASYTNRPERFGELISQERNGVTSYYHYDGAHSTRQLTDENGSVTDTFIYSADGVEVARTGATTNPFGYKGAVGYYTNSATGDIYVRARMYQPTSGRWLSMDPLGFADGPNLYRAYFVPNSVDPSGELEYGNFCGLQSGGIGVDPKDAVDECCRVHDECLATPVDFLIPCRIFICDEQLAACAYSALIAGCRKSPTPWACRRAAILIMTWMGNPVLGTTPLTPPPF